MSDQDKRRFPRVSVGTGVRYRLLQTAPLTLSYLEGVLENVGLGGIFIATEAPLPKGSLVEVEFRIREQEEEDAIRAQALVRWDRTLFKPRGMGLEFVEFEGFGKQKLETWLRKILGGD